MARGLAEAVWDENPCHCERSEAIHSSFSRRDGLLRRSAPLHKRSAFVAGNDEWAAFRAPTTVIASEAKQSILPCGGSGLAAGH
jgi:hypothetical protein